ncbi:MAG: ABC transporter permease [Planctomycetota bacterium]|nr:ABC transporter permease [Planctomycetota bacterium]
MQHGVVYSAKPTPLPRLLNPVEPWRTLWVHRDLLRQFAVRYVQQRYRGTHLGMLWAIMLPLLMLTVYAFVFNFVLSARFGTGGDEPRSHYVVMLFCGLTVYTVFSETLVRSCSIVLENPAYVKKVVFPVEILPPAQLAASAMASLVGIVLTVIGVWMFVRTPSWTVVLFPIVVAPLLLLTLGIAWFLASLGVFVRDVANIVGLIVGQMLIFLSPVFFSLSQLPEPWRGVASWNPLSPILDGARKVLTRGEMPDWGALGAVALLGLVVMQLGYAWFMKSKRGFADVL